MAGKSKAVFDAQSFANAVLKKVTDEQSRRLVEYAKKMVLKIGNRILDWTTANHLDRTGNLLNSLCWGVSYRGKVVDSGFFRDEVSREKGHNGTSDAYLHEWYPDDLGQFHLVEGRQLAQRYIESYGNSGYAGWKVFFSIRAPYWGYWEKGFYIYGEERTSYKQYNKQRKIPKVSEKIYRRHKVMEETYDQVKADLKPMRVKFRASKAPNDISTTRSRWERSIKQN